MVAKIKNRDEGLTLSTLHHVIVHAHSTFRILTGMPYNQGSAVLSTSLCGINTTLSAYSKLEKMRSSYHITAFMNT